MPTITERILEGLLTTLQQHLPPLLQQHNLPAVQSWNFGIPPLQRVTETPAIAVAIDTQRLAQMTVGPERVGRIEHQLPLLVIVYVSDRDETTLYRLSLNYVDCVIAAIELSPTLNNTVLVSTPRLIDMSPPLERRGQAFLMAALVEVNAVTRRTRGQT